MAKEELKKWFWNKFNNCYYVAHDDYPKSLFMYYDEIFIRYMKLCKLSKKELIMPNKPRGICLFEQDYKDGYLYLNYDEITEFFYKNYSSYWSDIKELIIGWLKETEKTNILTPGRPSPLYYTLLKETEKINILTPNPYAAGIGICLKETEIKKTNILTPVEKISILTPEGKYALKVTMLKESEKINILTPGTKSFYTLF